MTALPYPDPPLRDGLVALRPWQPADAELVAAWARDPEIVRWTGVPEGQTAAAARSRRREVEEDRSRGEKVELVIVDAGDEEVAGDGRALGACDIRFPDLGDGGLAEIGYLLAPEARGRGVATRALWLLIDWGVRELRVQRVQALVHPENPASARVLDHLGFRREGLLRHYRAAKPGQQGREDRIMYALLAGELRRGS